MSDSSSEDESSSMPPLRHAEMKALQEMQEDLVKLDYKLYLRRFEVKGIFTLPEREEIEDPQLIPTRRKQLFIRKVIEKCKELERESPFNVLTEQLKNNHRDVLVDSLRSKRDAFLKELQASQDKSGNAATNDNASDDDNNVQPGLTVPSKATAQIEDDEFPPEN